MQNILSMKNSRSYGAVCIQYISEVGTLLGRFPGTRRAPLEKNLNSPYTTPDFPFFGVWIRLW